MSVRLSVRVFWMNYAKERANGKIIKIAKNVGENVLFLLTNKKLFDRM